jgi:rSAM/selenodomain-associated transferase 2
MRLSIIIPVLNEAETLVSRLAALQGLRAGGVEAIVVDGGSADDSAGRSLPFADRVITAPRGRGRQMNAGAEQATGEVLLFLHADTVLPDSATERIEEVMEGGAHWGRFDVRIEGASIMLPVVAALMNMRSRLTGIATGDQAIFITREAFARVGGFPDIPLMEDIAFSSAMRRIARPACLAEKVTTSGRRWEKHGVWRTILTMWWLRLRFWLGVSPQTLAREYGYVPRND